MSLNFNIKFERKDLWLLAAIMVFIIAVGYVIAYNSNMRSGNPAVMGHSAGEVMVENKTGSLVSLQTLIDQGGLGGGSCSLGAWESKSINTVYQASTDGFVVAYGSGEANLRVYTDSSQTLVNNSDSSVLKERIHSCYGGCEIGDAPGITTPIRKGDYWKINGERTTGAVVNWIPLNCGGGGSGSFGAWTDKDSLGNTILGNKNNAITNQYKATSDGFIVARVIGGEFPQTRGHVKLGGVGSFIEMYDSTQNSGGSPDQSFSMPIGKDDIFYITQSRNDAGSTWQIYWKPLGSGELVKQ